MSNKIKTRKNVLSLSPSEKQEFINGILALKKSGTYDQFVRWHVDAMNMGPNMPMGVYPHQSPIFLPWHRYFIAKFENAIGVTLPYWDWAADSSLDDPEKSPFWSDDLMGGSGDPNDHNYVKDGPFANWPVTDVLMNPDGTWRNLKTHLTRKIGLDPVVNSLPTQQDVDPAINTVPYDSPNWDATSNPSFRNKLEGWLGPGNVPELHNRVHVWVGGSMALMSSPNDPCFFLHHANIDRIWMRWRTKHQNQEDYPQQGAITDQNGNPIQNLNRKDKFQPWNDITVESVLDSKSLGYQYDTLK